MAGSPEDIGAGVGVRAVDTPPGGLPPVPSADSLGEGEPLGISTGSLRRYGAVAEVAPIASLPTTEVSLQIFFRELNHLLEDITHPGVGASGASASSPLQTPPRSGAAAAALPTEDEDGSFVGEEGLASADGGMPALTPAMILVAAGERELRPDATLGEKKARLLFLLRRIQGDLVHTAAVKDSKCITGERGLTGLFAYAAALKAAMGSASLIELIATSLGRDLADSSTAALLIPTEFAVGLIFAMPTSLAFYDDNVRKGLIALGLISSSTASERILRDTFSEMSWSKFIPVALLALGFGASQAGMVGSTFYLTELDPSLALYLIAPLLAAANFFIGVPKALHIIDKILGCCSSRRATPDVVQRPTSASDVVGNILAVLGSFIAVLPNILGAGRLFFGEQRIPFIPDTGFGFGGNLALQLGVGSILSIAPFGLNDEELERLIAERNKILEELGPRAAGFAGAAVSAAFSFVFTYANMIRAFDPSSSTEVVPDTDNKILEVAAIIAALVNSGFVVITKGGSVGRILHGITPSSYVEAVYGIKASPGLDDQLEKFGLAFEDLQKCNADHPTDASVLESAQKTLKASLVVLFTNFFRERDIKPEDKISARADAPTYRQVFDKLAEAVIRNPDAYQLYEPSPEVRLKQATEGARQQAAAAEARGVTLADAAAAEAGDTGAWGYVTCAGSAIASVFGAVAGCCGCRTRGSAPPPGYDPLD